MPQVLLFGIGQQGKSPKVTAQRRLNMYFEFQPEGDRTMVAAFGTPGLELFVDFGDTAIRGLHPKGDYLYVVHRGTLWEVNNAGQKTSRGTLQTTSGLVSMENNGTQIMIADGTYGYIFDTSTNAFNQITDADFPGAGSVTYQDMYFIVNKPDSGRFYISAQNDGLNWDALDFANAESEPDNLLRVISDHSELILFGEVTTEFWGNTGAQDFPFARVQGASNEWGLAAKWSLTKYDNSLVFLAQNRMGEVIVARLNAYQPQRISNFELEHVINNYNDVSDAVGFAYMLGGHPMYQLNFPAAGVSWLYDGSTNIWTELESKDITRHRAETYAHYLKQNIVGDYTNGKVYKLKQNVYTDNGEAIRRQLRGKHLFKDNKWVIVDALQLDMETGVGLATGQGDDPKAMLRYSKDGGHTWSDELWTSIGKMGEYLARVIWRRLGRARDWVFEITISDPVKVAITSTDLKVRQGVS